VKEGIVEDSQGKKWNQVRYLNVVRKSFTKILYQKRHYEEGVGAVQSMTQKLYSGLTGKGVDQKIKDIYKVPIRFLKA
jgi:hypothetical protein